MKRVLWVEEEPAGLGAPNTEERYHKITKGYEKEANFSYNPSIRAMCTNCASHYILGRTVCRNEELESELREAQARVKRLQDVIVNVQKVRVEADLLTNLATPPNLDQMPRLVRVIENENEEDEEWSS